MSSRSNDVMRCRPSSVLERSWPDWSVPERIALTVNGVHLIDTLCEDCSNANYSFEIEVVVKPEGPTEPAIVAKVSVVFFPSTNRAFKIRVGSLLGRPFNCRM